MVMVEEFVKANGAHKILKAYFSPYFLKLNWRKRAGRHCAFLKERSSGSSTTLFDCVWFGTSQWATQSHGSHFELYHSIVFGKETPLSSGAAASIGSPFNEADRREGYEIARRINERNNLPPVNDM